MPKAPEDQAPEPEPEPEPELEHGTEPEPWEYTLYIPHDLRAVTICRRTLRLVLAAHGLPHFSEVAELLAAELVSNALCHTKGPAALRLRWTGGLLRVGVWDTDPRPPAPVPAPHIAPDAEQGRGLALVRSCADGWGWYPLTATGDTGKYVWCELSAA
ncbi:ATP-binding protein [Streptomyces sp. NPDC029674]|uniref:ATP-binding protein n=1 Tax=Streptomyces sp. NPDC029674 TaxID=3365297 RepID=UPI00384CE452